MHVLLILCLLGGMVCSCIGYVLGREFKRPLLGTAIGLIVGLLIGCVLTFLAMGYG